MSVKVGCMRIAETLSAQVHVDHVYDSILSSIHTVSFSDGLHAVVVLIASTTVTFKKFAQ